ncbi:MAG: dihydroneopterin aldolase [Microthrixaceae bacterium]|nr:dihydroneopterin aldolase [Microthrixaceae bacterium]MCO5311407.1 dihydroneopterin aldolase [Microthrixaceae bacterium]
MTDVIELRGLRALGYIGALAEEQQRRQPFEVDLDVEVDLSQSGHSDDLDDTVDYGALCATVEGIIEHERAALMERAAARIAHEVLLDRRIDAVTVSIRKLRPPVPQHLETSGVRIRREQRR